MPLSSKLKADYIELINQQLDSVQLDSMEDFELAQQALQNIIQPTTGYEIPEKYREKMFLIKDYLQSPEDYVEHVQNYDEYKQIIRDRITAKINEFQLLSAEQRNIYIQEQNTRRAYITQGQAIMASRRPPQPNSDAHVVSEDEWHREMQQRFQDSAPNIPRRNNVIANADGVSPLPEEQLATAVAAGVITLEQYLQIPSYDRESMRPLFSTDGREAVAAGVITLEQYLQIPSHHRESQLGDLINRNQQRPTM